MRQKLTKDKEVLRKRLTHLIKVLNSRNYTSLTDVLNVELIKEHYKDAHVARHKATDKQIPIVFSEPKIKAEREKFYTAKRKIGFLKRLEILFTGRV